jgi:hypothetical protein
VQNLAGWDITSLRWLQVDRLLELAVVEGGFDGMHLRFLVIGPLRLSSVVLSRTPELDIRRVFDSWVSCVVHDVA